RDKVTLLHILTLLESDGCQSSTDLWMDRDGVIRLHRSYAVQIDRNISFLYGTGHDRDGATGTSAPALTCFSSPPGLPVPLRMFLVVEIEPDATDKDGANQQQEPSHFSHKIRGP